MLCWVTSSGYELAELSVTSLENDFKQVVELVEV